MRQIDKTLVGHTEGKAAVEMALFDIAGKHLGVPVAQLLGGYYRSHVPLSVSIANPDFEEDLAFAKRLVAEGVNIFKVKTGFSTHKEDLQRLERLRADLPATVDLRVDYNQGLDPWDAIRQLKDVEAFRPTFIEQPVKRDQRAAMAAITRAIDTPIMADESVFSPAEAIDMVRGEIADLVSIKIMKSGRHRAGARDRHASPRLPASPPTAAPCSRAGLPSPPACTWWRRHRTSRSARSSTPPPG